MCIYIYIFAYHVIGWYWVVTSKSKKKKQDGNSQTRQFSASFMASWTASMAANFLFVCSSTAILLESKLLQEVGKVHLKCTNKY